MSQKEPGMISRKGAGTMSQKEPGTMSRKGAGMMSQKGPGMICYRDRGGIREAGETGNCLAAAYGGGDAAWSRILGQVINP